MPLHGLTVLAVDDYEAHNYALARTLKRAGSQVLQAFTGKQALEMARVRPDVILLDVHLPDLDGFEVCKRLKQNPATAHIPVVFLSATLQDSTAQDRAERVGSQTVLFYPVEPAQLIAVIQGQVARSADTSCSQPPPH